MVSKNILMGRVSWLSELVIHAELKFKQGGTGYLKKQVNALNLSVVCSSSYTCNFNFKKVQ